MPPFHLPSQRENVEALAGNLPRPTTSSSTPRPPMSIRHSEDLPRKPAFLDLKGRRDQQATHPMYPSPFSEPQKSQPVPSKESKRSLHPMKKFGLGKGTTQTKTRSPKRARSKIQKKNPYAMIGETEQFPKEYSLLRGPTSSRQHSSRGSTRPSEQCSFANSFGGATTLDRQSPPVPLASINAFKGNYVPPSFPKLATPNKTSTKNPTPTHFRDFSFTSHPHGLLLSDKLPPLQLIPADQSDESDSDSSKYFYIPENHPAIHDPNLITVFKSSSSTESLEQNTSACVTRGSGTTRGKREDVLRNSAPPNRIPPTAPLPQELEAPTTTPPVSLLIDSPAIDLYNSYKSTGKITPCLAPTTTRASSSLRSEETWKPYSSLINAYIHGISLHDHVFANRVIDILSDSIPRGLPADADTIFHVFAVRDAPKELKQFVVDWCVGAGDKFLGCLNVRELPKEFVCLALERAMRLLGKGQVKEVGEECRYHLHGQEEGCYKRTDEAGVQGEKPVEAYQDKEKVATAAGATRSSAQVENTRAHKAEALATTPITVCEAQLAKVIKPGKIQVVQIPRSRTGEASLPLGHTPGKARNECSSSLCRQRSRMKETVLTPSSSMESLRLDGASDKVESRCRIVVTSAADVVEAGEKSDRGRTASDITGTHKTSAPNGTDTSLSTSPQNSSTGSSDLLSVPVLPRRRLHSDTNAVSRRARRMAGSYTRM